MVGEVFQRGQTERERIVQRPQYAVQACDRNAAREDRFNDRALVLVFLEFKPLCHSLRSALFSCERVCKFTQCNLLYGRSWALFVDYGRR